MKCNDIDIYIFDHEYINESKEILNISWYHPFEKYILETITKIHYTKDSYYLVEGIYYSRNYISKNINIILLNKDCNDFINNNFDLDCCKITFDSDNVYVYDLEGIMSGKSKVRYNKCNKINQLYLDDLPYYGHCTAKINQWSTLGNSTAYIKLKILNDIYRFNKGNIHDLSIYKQIETKYSEDIYKKN